MPLFITRTSYFDPATQVHHDLYLVKTRKLPWDWRAVPALADPEEIEALNETMSMADQGQVRLRDIYNQSRLDTSTKPE